MTEPARHLHAVDAPVETDPLVGQVIDGRYVIERVLGQGGMGLVYRARHAMLGKPSALKVLRPEVSRDAGVMERFRREAQSASGIGSPHICDVSDFGTLPDGSTYFVMELLDGPSLTSVMERERPMGSERVTAIARQICDALGAAHAAGIVHRDLKPDNVHLVPRGADKDFVKVLDFGIAKVGSSADKKLTQAGQVFGTPHYMSPEQCSGREVDHRTDIYALGVMLYEMACGQLPFDADTLMGVLTKHVYEHPVPPHQLGAQVPPGLEAVILKCLAKNADERYGSMSALRADLDLLVDGGTPGAVREGVDRAARANAPPVFGPASAPVVAPAPPPPRSRAGLVIGALVCLALASGAGLAFGLGVFDGPAADELEVTTPPREDPVEDPVVEEALVEEDTTSRALAATIELSTEPPGAVVYDASGSLLGNTPVQLPRPTDAPVTYRVELAGHRPMSVPLGARTQEQLMLHLEREGRTTRRRDRTVTTSAATDTTTAQTASTPRETPRQRDAIDSLNDGIVNPFEDDPPPRRAPARPCARPDGQPCDPAR